MQNLMKLNLYFQYSSSNIVVVPPVFIVTSSSTSPPAVTVLVPKCFDDIIFI